jgi:hypothetical protein
MKAKGPEGVAGWKRASSPSNCASFLQASGEQSCLSTGAAEPRRETVRFVGSESHGQSLGLYRIGK